MEKKEIYIQIDRETNEALNYVFSQGYASVSMIQIYFKYPYAQAAKIIDTLEALGLISEFNGSAPRKLIYQREQVHVIIGEKTIIPDHACVNATQRINLGQSIPCNLNGYEFEQYIVELLIMLGFQKIYKTPNSNDYGADILAKKDALSYAFQCKYYTHPVGNAAIQEIESARQYYKCDIGVVVTNSTFTSNAINLASNIGISLWDKDILTKILKDVKDNSDIPIQEISEEELRELANKLISIFLNFEINIKIINVNIETKYLVFEFKTFEKIRINKLLGLNYDIGFYLGISGVSIKPNIENMSFLIYIPKQK